MKDIHWKVLSTRETFSPELNDNVITGCIWGVFCRDGQFMDEILMEQEFGPADPNNYTPFSMVTNDQMIGWLHAIIGQDLATDFETRVTAKLQAQQDAYAAEMALKNASE